MNEKEGKMKRSRKNLIRALLCGFFVVFPVLFFAGCELYGKPGGDDTNVPGELPSLLQGTWAFPPENPSELYTITADTVEYGYGDGASPMDFKGAICFVSNYSDDSGVIIIEYTEPPSYKKDNDRSFFAVYYRDLRSGSVKLANATTLRDYSAPDTATLEEAKEKFTRGKMGSYVDWGTVQPQERIS
jgi:hypothetical protein